MKRILRLSTPACAASFLVTGGTGVLWFFHIGADQVHALHQLAGLVMVVAVLLHVIRFWKPLLAYGRTGVSLQVSLVVAALATAGFLAAVGLGVGTGSPLDSLRRRLETTPLVHLAPVLEQPAPVLVARLRAAGLKEVTPESTVAQIATASRTSRIEVLEALAAPGP